MSKDNVFRSIYQSRESSRSIGMFYKEGPHKWKTWIRIDERTIIRHDNTVQPDQIIVSIVRKRTEEWNTSPETFPVSLLFDKVAKVKGTGEIGSPYRDYYEFFWLQENLYKILTIEV